MPGERVPYDAAAGRTSAILFPGSCEITEHATLMHTHTQADRRIPARYFRNDGLTSYPPLQFSKAPEEARSLRAAMRQEEGLVGSQ